MTSLVLSAAGPPSCRGPEMQGSGNFFNVEFGRQNIGWLSGFKFALLGLRYSKFNLKASMFNLRLGKLDVQSKLSRRLIGSN